MKSKMIATFMALAMVLTGFAIMAPSVLATVPVVKDINLVVGPIVTDNQNTAFVVAGVADVAVDVQLEVGATANFAIGAGSVTGATPITTATDNYPQGTFRILAGGMPVGSTLYHWRLWLTNGGDTVYYPSATTTATAQTCNPGTVPANAGAGAIIRYTDTILNERSANALYLYQAETAGVQSFFLSLIASGTGTASATGNNLRSSAAPYDYMQWTAATIHRYGGYAMFNSVNDAPDNGFCYWVNHSAPGAMPLDYTYTGWAGGNLPTTNMRLYPVVAAADPTATVTVIPASPTNDNTVALTYTWTETPASVDIYVSNNGGTSWVLNGNDATVDGAYTTTALADGTWQFSAVPAGGNPTDPIPTAAGDIEQGGLVIDTVRPTVTPAPIDGATGVSAAAGTYTLAFSEAMAAVGSVTTDLPGASGSWSGNNYLVTYTALTPSTTYNVAQNVAFTDLAGNTLLVAFAFDFTTAGETNPPQTTTTNLPAGYAGVLDDAFILTASGTDLEANVVSCQYRVDAGAWQPMTIVGAPGLTSNFQATIDLHGWTLVAHTIETRATDANSNVDATPDSDALTVTDTTAPEHGYDVGTPADGATRDTGSNIPIFVVYEDFTDYTVADYQVSENGGAFGAWTPMTLDGSWTGSYGNDFSFTVTLAADGFVDYQYRLTDGNGNAVVGAAQTLNFQTASAVVDPYPITGYTSIYDGTFAGGLEYNALNDVYGTLDDASAISITWYRTDISAWFTEAPTWYNAVTCQFSHDIYNYTDGGYVFINGTSATYGNQGYNYTVIDIVGEPGGARQDLMFGVPYDIVYNPIPAATVLAGQAYPVTYEVRDRNGLIAPGYFSYAGDGAFTDFFTDCPIFTNDAAHPLVWNGLADGGVQAASVVFTTGGLWYLNISEGGNTPAEVQYLTPWGAWTVDPLGAIPGYLNDWANTTVTVTSGVFLWNLVVGWNQICVPMNPDNDGGDLVFGMFDALREINDDIVGAGGQIAARQPGTNPSAYNTFDFGALETDIANLPLDYVHGYWVYVLAGGIVDVQAQNITAYGADNLVSLEAGWNLLGWTHNESVGGAMAGDWNVQPTSAMFTDGTIWAALDIAGAQAKIVPSWFIQATQRYQSYVVTDTFPGMAIAVWTYDTGFAYGYWVYTDVAVPNVLFDTDF